MKKTWMLLLIATSVNIFLDCSTGRSRSNKKPAPGNVHTATKNSSGGVTSTTMSSAGAQIRSRTSSNEKGVGHTATMTGQKATVTSSNTGRGTGTHTLTDAKGTGTQTVTNKEIALRDKHQESKTDEPGQKNNRFGSNDNKKRFPRIQKNQKNSSEDFSKSESSHPGMIKFAAAKKESSGEKGSEIEHVAFLGMAEKQAQNSEQNSSSSDSGSGSTTAGQAAQNNLFNAAVAEMQGPQVSSNKVGGPGSVGGVGSPGGAGSPGGVGGVGSPGGAGSPGGVGSPTTSV